MTFKDYLLELNEAKQDIEIQGFAGTSIIKGSKAAVLTAKEVAEAEQIGLKPYKWDDGQYTSGPYLIWKKIFKSKSFDPEKQFSIPFNISANKVYRAKVDIDGQIEDGWRVTAIYKIGSRTIRESFEATSNSITKI